MTPDDVLARVAVLLPAATPAPAEMVRGQAVVELPRDHVPSALQTLRDDPELGFDVLSDLTAVDYRGQEPRFQVVYNLNSLRNRHRLRVKCGLPEADAQIATASGVWKSALWSEREVFDLFGIRFTGHPDLRRILLYPEFEGHPLRKDYPLDLRHPLVPERDPILAPWRPRTEGR
jgi:NADH-quinone oxidoreductase subunit C